MPESEISDQNSGTEPQPSSQSLVGDLARYSAKYLLVTLPLAAKPIIDARPAEPPEAGWVSQFFLNNVLTNRLKAARILEISLFLIDLFRLFRSQSEI